MIPDDKNVNCIIYIFINYYLCGSFLNIRVKNFIVEVKTMEKSQFYKKIVSVQESMLTVALRLTANRDEARELMQETTLRVLSNREKYVENTNFKGWCYQIMKHIFINDYHRILRERFCLNKDADLYNLQEEYNYGLTTPGDPCDLEAINAAIDGLSEELRIPFSLYLAGFKYVEIAEQLGKPLGTVKNLIFTARQHLKKELVDFRLK